jgi:hypothetical protein
MLLAAGDCPTGHRGCPVGCCSMQLLPSALWESNRLVGCCFIKLERCLSTVGGYRTVLPLPCLLLLVVYQTRVLPLHCGRLPNDFFSLPSCCCGSWVQHDAPGALRGLFFHSIHVARWCVQRLPPLLLPSSCRVHCPCLLLCFLYGGVFALRGCSRWAHRVASTGFVVVVMVVVIVRSASCRLLISLSRPFHCSCIGDSLLLFMLPVVPDFLRFSC